MTPAIGHAIFAVSNSLAASIIVKATIAISIALVAATLARHSRASVRHAILAAGFAVILALPIAAVIAPPLHIALPIAQGSSIPTANSVQSFDEPTPAPGTATNAPSAAKSEATSFSLFDLLFIAWAFGAMVFLAPIIIGLWQVRSVRRTALPWSHGNAVATTLANELKISRRIEVLLHEFTSGPMTCGIFHPAVVFPVKAENWDDADLNRAIAHELEHVRRADWLMHCLARAVCSAYWFHPFVWIAWRQLTLEAERACDDAVLARSEATAYAEQLVALARQLTAPNKSPLLAMASRSDLTARINAVLDMHQTRGRAGKLTLVLACLATAFLMLAIAPIKVIAAAQSSSVPLSFDAVSIKPSNLPRMPVQFEAGGRFVAPSVPTRILMTVAYNLPFSTGHGGMIGGPDWLDSQLYDVEAHAIGDPPKQQMLLMLQNLLSTRFKLAMHWETRKLPAYALRMDKPGKLGPQLVPHAADNSTCRDPKLQAAGTDQLPSHLPACGGYLIYPGHIAVESTVAGLAQGLSWYPSVGRAVIDETRLTGVFDITVDYARSLSPTNATPDDESLPSTIFVALKEQLGLKLEPTTAPVRVLVIDHIEKPSPN